MSYSMYRKEGKAFQLQGPGCARVTTWGRAGTERRHVMAMYPHRLWGTTLTGWLPNISTSILKITKMRLQRGDVSHPRSQLLPGGAETSVFYL